MILPNRKIKTKVTVPVVELETGTIDVIPAELARITCAISHAFENIGTNPM